jgi:membrane associated rhomboid family serine protease
MPCAPSGKLCLETNLLERNGLHPWWAICAALALPALALHLTLPQGSVALDAPVSSWPPLAQTLVMRPDAGLAQLPWVWWSSAWLHGSSSHLLRNVAGLALLACLAWLMPPSRTAAAAWLLAWPLTHLGMLMEPTLSSYVGMSGVLHAGVVTLSLHGLTQHTSRHSQIGAIALLIATVCKVLMENPWAHSLVASPASAINVAPWAHFSGCAAAALSTWALKSFSGRTRKCH